jgi:hypothetical protein
VVELPWAADSCPCVEETANRVTIDCLYQSRCGVLGTRKQRIESWALTKVVGERVFLSRQRLEARLCSRALPRGGCDPAGTCTARRRLARRRHANVFRRALSQLLNWNDISIGGLKAGLKPAHVRTNSLSLYLCWELA